MKLFKYMAVAAIAGGALTLTGCRDDFAELNSNPSQVANAEVSYLFAQGILDFEPSGYLMYYYNAPMMQQWAQTGVSTGGYKVNFTATTNSGDQSDKYINVLKYVRAIENALSAMPEEEAAKYMGYLHCLRTLTAYLGVMATDMYGDVPFTEACMAAYGGTITPKYDNQADLYNLWLTQLDEAISTFTNNNDLVMVSKQDLAYNGDWGKWAKFANSVKLRIAARLINVDREKAKSLASAVASAPCGYIENVDDAMIFQKSTSNSTNNQDLIYHWSNGFLDGQAANQHLLGYMVDNLDPRVRFCYQKNEFNSKVIQAFWDKGQEIPSYIQKNVEFTEKDGKKTFVAWKGAGEPWVRYYGLPTAMDAGTDLTNYGDWFEAKRFRCSDKNDENLTSYTPYSQFQQQLIIGRLYNFKLPKAPGEPVTQSIDPRPWTGLYLGAGEVNLYLAEFKLLGANLPKSAEEYYEKGITCSTQEYDKLAKANKIAYYENTYGGYDPFEVSIELKAGEIETMLAKEGYKLTGSTADQLEKVYIQQMINFTMYPNEQFVTARRSGLPKFGSTIFPRQDFASVPVTNIPRRFDIGEPSITDIMRENIMGALSNMGWSTTSAGDVASGATLNSQRVYIDKQNPQYGEGPKM